MLSNFYMNMKNTVIGMPLSICLTSQINTFSNTMGSVTLDQHRCLRVAITSWGVVESDDAFIASNEIIQFYV